MTLLTTGGGLTTDAGTSTVHGPGLHCKCVELVRVLGAGRAVNPKGIRLEGRAGWLNFSKFAGALAPPVGGNGQGAGRETAITRLAVLKAAAEFAAGRAEIKSGDVLEIAARWEHWVNRRQEEG